MARRLDLGARYSFRRELGRGGTGSVLLVGDALLGRDVALKLLNPAPAEEESIRCFQTEFLLLARLEHPGIARAHDFGYFQGRPYFTRDYVAGEPLSQCARTLDPRQILGIAVEIADAVAFLHERELLHLDIKPSNIMLPESWPRMRPVLIDFGVYFRRGQPGATAACVRGSLPYLAPECIRGGGIGPWTDVYALGTTIYRLATGKLPRRVSASGQGGKALADWDPFPPPLAVVRPDLPGDLSGIVAKCLALDPEARFATASELVAALLRSGADAPRPRSSPPASTSLIGRTPELSQVDAFLDAKLRNKPDAASILLVTGAAGMGQSHLLREIKNRAQLGGLSCHLEIGYAGRIRAPGSLLEPLGESISSGDDRNRWAGFLARIRLPRESRRDEATEAERQARHAFEVARAASRMTTPLLLAVDGLQHCDEVSIHLVSDLVDFLAGWSGSVPHQLSLILGYREEGAAAPLLQKLTAAILASTRREMITLRPLSLEETLRMHRQLLPGEPPAQASLAVLQSTGGSPARIAALARHGSDASAGAIATGAFNAAVGRSRERSGAARLLLALELLRRPASVAELSRFAGMTRAHAQHGIVELARAGRVLESLADSGRRAWVPAPDTQALAIGASDAELRRAHARIARALLSKSSASDSQAVIEGFQHLRSSASAAGIVRFGLLAGRYLRLTRQHRRALETYGAVLQACRRRRGTERFEAALAMADLHARIGETGIGIRLLKDMLREIQPREKRWGLKLLLQLATLHSRNGDFQRAEALFTEGLSGSGRSLLDAMELLPFVNEHAALKGFLGDYDAALALCAEGLRLARRSKEPRYREIALTLHATRASVYLRTFAFEDSIREFQRSLDIAEAIGSTENQATVLNNLGIAYNQCDRYAEAVRAFSEAERTSQRLDEGPSLTSIHSNLAMLHAKLGDFESMDAALLEAERLGPAALGRRQEFFLRHARGLCLLWRGRPGPAVACLDAALTLGRALGDSHITSFDEGFRAEALILEARYQEAAVELARLTRPDSPPQLRRLALARRAFLSAYLGQPDEVAMQAAAWASLAPARPIQFLDAWDHLYLAWAHILILRSDRAQPWLDLAESYFARHGLRPPAALVQCLRAESALASGRAADGLLHVGHESAGENDLAAALRCLLHARLLLETGRGSEIRLRCADLLARAGGFLVGNAIPEWQARLDALRDALTDDGVSPSRAASARRTRVASALPQDLKTSYLESPCWRLWVDLKPAPRLAVSLRARERKRRSRAGAVSDTRTVLISRADPEPLRKLLVTRSTAMKALSAMLDRVRGTDLPVLVEGETGTGKELVAHILHEESPRGRGPLRVVDCATLPAELLEAELFGARAGAFTGQEVDREGILRQAHGGTVLIDHLEGASLEAQAKLLRVLSESKLRPLGAEDEVVINVRFLFSTSVDLEEEVTRERFRRDLFHRIHVIRIRVPPLRERLEDFPELVTRFLAEGNRDAPAIPGDAVDRLRGLSWPGNVRELRNLVTRAGIEGEAVLTAEALTLRRATGREPTMLPESILARESIAGIQERAEREYLLHHFERLGGDAAALCRHLGWSRQQLYRRCGVLRISLRTARRRLGLAERRNGQTPSPGRAPATGRKR